MARNSIRRSTETCASFFTIDCPTQYQMGSLAYAVLPAGRFIVSVEVAQPGSDMFQTTCLNHPVARCFISPKAAGNG